MLTATIAYVVVAYFQWKAISGTNAISARALDAIDRPILIISFGGGPPVDRPGRYSFPATIRNVGRDYALNLRSEVFVSTYPTRQDPFASGMFGGIEEELVVQTDTALQPDGKIERDLWIDVDASLLKKLESGGLSIYAFGRALYEDRLGRTHRVELQRVLEGSVWRAWDKDSRN